MSTPAPAKIDLRDIGEWIKGKMCYFCRINPAKFARHCYPVCGSDECNRKADES